jgi:DNA-binding CsgD family transcriptional regulator
MEDRVSNTELSGLIGAIYDCALDPGRWPETLGHIYRAVGCVSASLTVQEIPSGRVLLTVTEGIPSPYRETINNYGPNIIAMWGGLEKYVTFPMDQPAVLSRENPRENWESNRYYIEWAVPQGLADTIGVVLAQDATAFGTLGMGRHVSAGDVTELELDLLRLLIPHLQRAVSISRLLDVKTVEARSFAATLDTITAGIVLVDEGLGIVHANRTASAALAAGDLIASVAGRLTLRSKPEHDALAAAVSQAAADETLIGRRGQGIAAGAASGPAAILYVLPLNHGPLRGGISPRAVAAVFIAPPAEAPPAPEQALAALFDLTPTEAKVFSQIASGKSLTGAAAALDVAQSTVKSHLKRIFAKTGTSRQAELVRLAASLAMFA